MQLTQGIVDFVRCELSVKEKIFENGGVEIFDSGYFGKIMVEDNQALYCEHDSAMRHEIMVHTAMCTHADPKRVLLIDGGDSAAVIEVLKHKGVHIDIIEHDKAMIDAGKLFGFRGFDKDSVSLHIGDVSDFVAKAGESDYDIVIINRFDQLLLDSETFMGDIDRILDEKGLVVMDASSQLFDMTGHKAVLSALNNMFKIVMPFRYTSMVRTGGEQWLAMGSKFYHPTADINLQRADLTEGMHYYNSDMQIASFALPTSTFEALKDYIKR